MWLSTSVCFSISVRLPERKSPRIAAGVCTSKSNTNRHRFSRLAWSGERRHKDKDMGCNAGTLHKRTPRVYGEPPIIPAPPSGMRLAGTRPERSRARAPAIFRI